MIGDAGDDDGDDDGEANDGADADHADVDDGVHVPMTQVLGDFEMRARPTRASGPHGITRQG
eukprot:4678369-Pyramimonas_sp.AAC.1